MRKPSSTKHMLDDHSWQTVKSTLGLQGFGMLSVSNPALLRFSSAGPHSWRASRAGWRGQRNAQWPADAIWGWNTPSAGVCGIVPANFARGFHNLCNLCWGGGGIFSMFSVSQLNPVQSQIRNMQTSALAKCQLSTHCQPLEARRRRTLFLLVRRSES